MDASSVFEQRIQEVQAVIDTPNTIRAVAIQALRSVDDGKSISNPIANAIRSLENIQDESIENAYKAIYNTACVLIVSSLADAFQALFIEYGKVNSFSPEADFSKKVTVDVTELINVNASGEALAKLIIKNDPSIKFEDIGSVVRAFKNYYNFNLSLTVDEEATIIFYTQCRHILAHAGGRVNEAFITRTGIRDANIKNYALDQDIVLDLNDWEKMKRNFSSVVTKIFFACIPF